MSTQTETAEGQIFLDQNKTFTKTLTTEDIAVVDEYAADHAGGLVVLIRELPFGRYVKTHDSWGDDGQIVVHFYDPENADDPTETEVYFATGHEAIRAFMDAC